MHKGKAINRFITAQNNGGVWKAALKEIASGRKESHWIWFVFPQLKGLGTSYMSDYYGIKGIGESHTFMRNATLRNRIRFITKIAMKHKNIHPTILFGSDIDAVKVRSCFTLFKRTALTKCDKTLFSNALDLFFNGKECEKTIELLSKQQLM